jgi:RNA polymerase sigma factor (sigma-70 family)
LENVGDIVKGCMIGDHKFQRILYERYRGYALKIVFRYIYSYDRALDLVNDGFVKVFGHFTTFKCDDEQNIEKVLMGWIKRIMINVSIDELRRLRFLPEIGGIPDHIWDIPDNASADQLVLYKDLILIVKRLPSHYRAVFNLYVIDGFTHYEIADALEISVGTSKSSLSRARALIQKYIKNEEKVAVWSL